LREVEKENEMRKVLLAAIALAALSGSAYAGVTIDQTTKTMSADFAGEWCYGDGYDAQLKSTNFKLPSWIEEGKDCDKSKILSISKDYFYFNHTGYFCSVVSAKYSHDTAPLSGKTAYMVNVVAKCQKDSSAQKTMTFEFFRYKGNLEIK